MTRDEHELMRLIRRRVAQQLPMSQIAAELGRDIDDLCAFIMAYREPKRQPYVNRMSAPGWRQEDDGQDRQRLANWKRAHDGAVKARLG